MSDLLPITGDQIKEAREYLRESQYEFCLRLGVIQTTLSRWEASGPPRGLATRNHIESVVRPILARKAADEKAMA